MPVPPGVATNTYHINIALANVSNGANSVGDASCEYFRSLEAGGPSLDAAPAASSTGPLASSVSLHPCNSIHAADQGSVKADAMHIASVESGPCSKLASQCACWFAPCSSVILLCTVRVIVSLQLNIIGWCGRLLMPVLSGVATNTQHKVHCHRPMRFVYRWPLNRYLCSTYVCCM